MVLPFAPHIRLGGAPAGKLGHLFRSLSRRKCARSWASAAVASCASPGALCVTEDVDQALAWLDRFDDLQRERIVDKGAPYILDREPYASFYRTLARSGLPDKRIAMAALMAGMRSSL